MPVISIEEPIESETPVLPSRLQVTQRGETFEETPL